MKKTIVYIMATLLLSVCAVILFAVFDNTTGSFGFPSGGTASVSFTKDKTVLPNFIYNSSSIAEFPAYTIHLTDSDIADEDDADFVVLGTVIETFYTFADGSAWTQANIRIDEITRGKLSEGDIISVYIPGGYASMEDYRSAHGSSKYSLSGASYLEFIVNDEPHPQPGDNAVFCLKAVPSSSPLPDSAYLRLNVIIEDELDIVEEADEALIG